MTLIVVGEPSSLLQTMANDLRSIKDGYAVIAEERLHGVEYVSDVITVVSASRVQEWRNQLHKFYYGKPEPKKTIRCMVTGLVLPKAAIAAGHIFKFSFQTKDPLLPKKLVDLDDINSMRNGILMFKPVEFAFDTSQISFVGGSGPGTLMLVIRNPMLRKCTFQDFIVGEKHLRNLPELKNLPLHVKTTTFGDFEERDIDFKQTPGGNIWHSRCFAFQATVSRRTAIKNGWIDAKYPIRTKESDWASMNKSKADVIKWMSEVQ